MEERSLAFLKRLLSAPGPSGFEAEPAGIWREEARSIGGLSIEGDSVGNSYATLGSGTDGPRVMLAGHIDEIGVMVTYIDDGGLLFIQGIGGWDPQVLVGQRVVLLTQNGKLHGVVGKKAIHLMKSEEREKASKMEELWIDIGAEDKQEAIEAGVRVGDPAVLDTEPLMLGRRRIASRSVDNRIGSFVVLEALRLLVESGKRPKVNVTAVATAQEEIGDFPGARTAAYRLNPAAAIAVDVTHASDVPGVEKKQSGDHGLGSGPVLSRGSVNHPALFEDLARTARDRGIEHTIEAEPRRSGTDADGIHLSRAGIATGLVAVPNRYMHSPSEIVQLDDLVNSARLIAAYLEELTEPRVTGYGQRF